jgi:uncharacterized iron-regulated protein
MQDVALSHVPGLLRFRVWERSGFRAFGGYATILRLVLVISGCNATTTRPPPPSAPARLQWESPRGVDHPLAGVIVDVAGARRVTEAELVARVQAAGIVLVGEIHDNPDHHRLQARLLHAFAATHPAPAVVFEMLDRDRQRAVDASLAAHPGDADALGRAVAWESSGWPPWSMYRPVFDAALGAHTAILGAGIDRREAMRIAQGGVAAFDPALVHPFGLDTPLPPDEQAAIRREMSEVHCGLLPESMLDAMVLVQRARDALMAERLHRGTEGGRGALLIAGAGHVRRDRGVPAQLMRAYSARALAIGLVPVQDANTTPESYAAGFDATVLPFDFVWFTPRTEDVDHCAEMRAHVGEQR